MTGVPAKVWFPAAAAVLGVLGGSALSVWAGWLGGKQAREAMRLEDQIVRERARVERRDAFELDRLQEAYAAVERYGEVGTNEWMARYAGQAPWAAARRDATGFDEELADAQIAVVNANRFVLDDALRARVATLPDLWSAVRHFSGAASVSLPLYEQAREASLSALDEIGTRIRALHTFEEAQ